MFSRLPFMYDRSCWHVEPTFDWAADCGVGSDYAILYIDLARSEFAPPLCWIVRDMIRVGQWTGIEAGFLSTIGANALRYCPVDIWDDHPAQQSDVGRSVVKT